MKRKPATTEHPIQNEIRNDLAGDVFLYRANVGSGWAGNKTAVMNNGARIIFDPRHFDTGLPSGFSDLFGFLPVVITPDMVGKTIAQFVAIECKSLTGAKREAQVNFINAVTNNGGLAGFARSVQQGRDIIEGRANHEGSGVHSAPHPRRNRVKG
ncbi:MAG TPA: hypothetical protein VJM50_23970 [Pyrinomonadaceae bacterium]|nr:hypothetical protein [Pyrinomonadaceae bacterium]